MKVGQHIQFRVTEYTSDKTVKSKTDEVREGIVTALEGDGWMVRVTDAELPYYATESDLCEVLC